MHANACPSPPRRRPRFRTLSSEDDDVDRPPPGQADRSPGRANRPSHEPVAPDGAWGRSGIAALKTRALQALARPRRVGEVAKRLECVRFIGAFGQERTLQRFMAPRRAGLFGVATRYGLRSRRRPSAHFPVTESQRGLTSTATIRRSKARIIGSGTSLPTEWGEGGMEWQPRGVPNLVLATRGPIVHNPAIR